MSKKKKRGGGEKERSRNSGRTNPKLLNLSQILNWQYLKSSTKYVSNKLCLITVQTRYCQIDYYDYEEFDGGSLIGLKINGGDQYGEVSQ